MVESDDCLFKLIYASRKYITFMEHETVKKYIENKKKKKRKIQRYFRRDSKVTFLKLKPVFFF